MNASYEAGDRLRVAVVGARGRMGRYACELIRGREDWELAGAFDREDPWREQVAASGAQVALELTVAGQGARHGMELLEAGVRPVIGTSGVRVTETEELDRRARELGLGGVVVPNFSLGMYVLQRAAVQASHVLRQVEILELHHDRKADAPSGTALETARLIEAEPGGGQHASGSIPIHSVRLPGLYAHQEVLLGGPGEVLSLRHDMLGPEAFGPGILAAVAWAARATGVARGIGAVLVG